MSLTREVYAARRTLAAREAKLRSERRRVARIKAA
jgi:hypothetical protein